MKNDCLERQIGVILTTQTTQSQQIAELKEEIAEIKTAVLEIKLAAAELNGQRQGATALAGLLGGLFGAAITLLALYLEYLR